MRAILLPTVLSGLVGACAHPGVRVPTPSRACSAQSAPGAGPLPAARLPLLAGDFRLVTVLTSSGGPRRQADTSALTLHLANSSERAASRVQHVGHAARRDLQLLGTWRWAPASAHERPLPAEVDAGMLYLGCRNCLDGSPWHLWITGADSIGFWGTWRNYQTGTLRAVDEAGHLLPDPAGFFCATRQHTP